MGINRVDVVSPWEEKRKARESNPHDPEVARLTVSGSLPGEIAQVGGYGRSYRLPGHRNARFLASHLLYVRWTPSAVGTPRGRVRKNLHPCSVDRRGIAPRFPPCHGGVFLFDQQPITHRGPAGSRTQATDPPSRCVAVTQDRLVAEVGVEPTDDHQALDLVALPALRTRPSSRGPRGCTWPPGS